MPSASELAAVVLDPPPKGLIIHSASESSVLSKDYDTIIENTLCNFPDQDIQSFRMWLESVPFDFDEIKQTNIGRVSESEGDVRLFFELAVIIACWPVALAMVPVRDRGYDLALRSEKTLKGRSRPDISISKVSHGMNGTFTYNPINIVKFKAPGVLNRVCLSGSVNVNAGDDWDIVSSQIRKYAIYNTVQNIVVIDDQWGIYIHFNNPHDINAVCNYIVAPVGTRIPGLNLSMTLREIFLFSVFKSLSVQGQLRYAAFSQFPIVMNIPNKAQEIHRKNNSTLVLDYIQQFNDIAPPSITPSTPRRSTRTGSGTTSVVLRYTKNQVFPHCSITEFDITPPRAIGVVDSGFEGPIRRSGRQFFVSNIIAPSLEMEVREYRGKAMISPPSDSRRPSTPPVTADLVLKHFSTVDIVGVFQEVIIYAALKKYQGLIIPFCYGVFDIDGIDGVGILLENVSGPTLIEHLTDSAMKIDKIRSLYLDCFNALDCMHSAGYAHRDVRGENFIISAGQIVLIDFENSKPANQTSKRLDKVALRRIFRSLGVDEDVLKGWAV